MRHWLYLLTAILAEVAGTSCMKIFQAAFPLIGMILMYLLIGLSYFCLAKAVKVIPVGVAYAFWEGLGLIIITLVSIFILKDSFTPLQLMALGMVFTGTMLINKGTSKGDMQ